MPGRSFNPTASKYGFGGQEKDDEISGSGNSYTAEYWQYDPRLGRRWNIDPIVYPWQSSYACFNNNPIVFNDPLGLEGGDKKGDSFVGEDGKTYSTSVDATEVVSDKSTDVANSAKGATPVAAKVAYDASTRLKYYLPKVEEAINLHKAGAISDGTYSMLRYQTQKATKMQLTKQGQALSEMPGFGKPLSKQKSLAESIASGEKSLSSNAYNTRGSTTTVATAAKVLGTTLVVASAGMSIHHIVTADNKSLAASQEVGGWAGAWAGAEVGGVLGAEIGLWGGPVAEITVPIGGIVGGLIGGVAGYTTGYGAGEELYNSATNKGGSGGNW